ncbi:DUF3289 family protein [Photobacterium sp. Hal280]|uniref:DUF3289 family protein n=1 Tax=Photobacterium sp. Hal280 TaxID=3035163 RepID=UPI00301C8B59
MSNKKSIFPVTSMAYESPERLSPITPEEDLYYNKARENSFFPTWSMAYEGDLLDGKITPPISISRNVTTNNVVEGDPDPIQSLMKTQRPLSDKVFAGITSDSKDKNSIKPISHFGDFSLFIGGEPIENKNYFSSLKPQNSLKASGSTASIEINLNRLGEWTFSFDETPVLPAWCVVFSPIGMGGKHLLNNNDLSSVREAPTNLIFRVKVNKEGRECLIPFQHCNHNVPVVMAEKIEVDTEQYQAILPNGLCLKWDRNGDSPINTKSSPIGRMRLDNVDVQPEDSGDFSDISLENNLVEEVIISFPAESKIEPLYLTMPKFITKSVLEVNAGLMFWPTEDKTNEDKWNPVPSEGYPIKIYQTKRKMDDYSADDLQCGDLTSSDILKMGVIEVFNRNKSELDYDADEHFDNMRSGVWYVSWGEYGSIIGELIDRFQESTGEKYSSPLLSKAMKEHYTTNDFSNSISRYIANYLKENNCLIGKDFFSVISQKLNENDILPKFSGYGSWGNGTGIAVHDVWSVIVKVKELEFNGNQFRGIIEYKIQDHFGLDKPDVNGGKNFELLSLFRSWFLLQRYEKYAYKPFITEMNFDYIIEGEF